MTTSQLRWILVSIFFLSILVIVGWVNATRPKLLILHSYSSDYVWTREIDEGINRIFKHMQFIHVRRFYMKTKKFNDKDSLTRAGITARHVIEQTRPDVILAVDDYAQKLAAKYYVNHPGVKIVFAGVNGHLDDYGYDKAKNVTGILERKPVRGIVEAIVSVDKLHNHPRAIFLGDSSYTVQADADYMLNQNWEPVTYQGFVPVKTFSEWKQRIISLKNKTDVLLVGGYRKIQRSEKDTEFVPPAELMHWTETNSPVPVIGMNVFNTADGIMLSIGVSPYEQGEVSAKMARDLLQHSKKISELPIRASKQFVVAMRGKELKKRGIVMPRLYEAFARATQNYIAN